ncbi:MAG: hypothetical protein L0Y72_26305 [Gemmataceae bacterium]|nr:hypothetical protein [Gemmataceae bacterium]
MARLFQWRRQRRQPAQRTSPVRTTRLGVEQLEDRCVPATFLVNNPADVIDPNDGVLTLREAVAQANAMPGFDIIKFDMAALPDEPFSTQAFIRLGGTQLSIADDLTIEGPGRDELRLSGEGLSRVFEVMPGVEFTVSDLTIASGQVAGDGGAILNHGIVNAQGSRLQGNAASGRGGAIANEIGATLNVSLCVFEGNSADSGGAIGYFGAVTVGFSTFDANRAIRLGGAIAGNGPLTVTHSLLANNRAGLGGALYLVGDADTFLHDVTVSGNQADGGGAPDFSGGGGIFSSNRLTIQHSTISNNRLSAGIGNGIDGGRFTGSSLSLLNTIVAGNSHDAGNPADISGSASPDSSYNLIGQGGGLTNGVNGNIVGVADPQLSPLVDHGGPTRVHALLPGSPALNVGPASNGSNIDQRGLPRLFGSAVDIGAYEAQTLSLLVDVGVDISNDNFRAGDLSLREAVELSNKNPGEDSIQFAGVSRITLLGQELTLVEDVTITGPGADQLTINGNNGSRVFSVSAGVHAELSGLTIRGGRTDGRGGAILNVGNLTLRDSIVSQSTAHSGGGIANEGGAVLTLSAVTIAGNSAELTGGGVYNLGALTISASFISGNEATNRGGGISNDGTLTVTDSTLDANVAGSGQVGSGGGIRNDGALTLTGSTLSNNSAAEGGGLFGFGSMTVSNATFSGNLARLHGGAIATGATLTLQHSTLTANRADADGDGIGFAGGLNVFQGTTLLHHTIVAGNRRGAGSTADDVNGVLIDNGSFNLIGDGTGMVGISNGANGNQVGTFPNPIDPHLAPLQNNGGLTSTHALPLESPAIDAGDPNLNPAPKTDQRGSPRVRFGRVDIGAFELFSAPVFDPPTLTGPDSPTPSAKPAITWNGPLHAAGYELWVDSLSGGQIHESGIAETSFTPANALPLGTYRAWVRVVNEGELPPGQWSAALDFTIVVPAAPVLSSPGRETMPSFTFIWNAVEGAATYELWVNNLSTGQGQVIQEIGLSVPRFEATSLSVGNHRAWVRAVNHNGDAGPWSAAYDFSVVVVLTPAVTAPIGQITDTTPTITWSSIAAASRYELWVDHLSTGQSRVMHRTDLTNTTFTPAERLAVGSYRVWVRAFNAQGQASKWSDFQDFQLTAPAAPALTGPEAETTDKSPTIAWNAVADAARYDLWVDNLGTGQSQIIREAALIDTSFAPAAALPHGQYRAWVRAINDNGVPGSWSAARDFRIVAVLTPALTAPAGITADTTPEITWSNIAAATRYELWVDNLGTGQSQVIHDANLTVNNFTPSVSLRLGLYRAWVRAFDAAGQASRWSTPHDFRIVPPAAPILAFNDHGDAGVWSAELDIMFF